MAVVCEDLAQYGVALIPPSTEEYFALLADIEQRLQNRPKGGPPLEEGAVSRIAEHDTTGSAILVNRAPVAIASVAYVWTFRVKDGRETSARHRPGPTRALLPYGGDNRLPKFDLYWNTIFSGSKRLMTAEGRMYGDNTDVRPPDPDEVWYGGFMISSGSAWAGPSVPVKLTLDGVFFIDGGFAGPDRLATWEETVFARETYLSCAKLAREATDPGAFFTQVRELTGFVDDQAPPPPGPLSAPDLELLRGSALWTVGQTVFWLRKYRGDEAAMKAVASWPDVPAPTLHKL